jgi:hypothetical protein
MGVDAGVGAAVRQRRAVRVQSLVEWRVPPAWQEHRQANESGARLACDCTSRCHMPSRAAMGRSGESALRKAFRALKFPAFMPLT